MIVAEKPELDEDLLMHFGIKGMRWGVRKEYVPVGNSYSPAPAAPRQPMSRAKKVAIGVGVTVGVTAALYVIAQRGQGPKTAAFSSKANRTGLRIAGKLLKGVGKAGYKTVPKVATATGKTTGKLGVKATTAIGKGSAKGIAKVAVTSSTKTLEGGRKSVQAIARSYRNVQLKRALRSSPQTIEAGANLVQSQWRRRIVRR